MGVFVDDEEIAACGRVYAQVSARATAGLFPEQIAARPVETPYSLEDLRADLPVLAGEILAQPNVNIVDVTTLGADGVVDDEAAVAAMVEYGGSAVTVLTAPEVPGAFAGMRGWSCGR